MNRKPAKIYVWYVRMFCFKLKLCRDVLIDNQGCFHHLYNPKTEKLFPFLLLFAAICCVVLIKTCSNMLLHNSAPLCFHVLHHAVSDSNMYLSPRIHALVCSVIHLPTLARITLVVIFGKMLIFGTRRPIGAEIRAYGSFCFDVYWQ